MYDSSVEADYFPFNYPVDEDGPIRYNELACEITAVTYVFVVGTTYRVV